jgi:hypothetical protein
MRSYHTFCGYLTYTQFKAYMHQKYGRAKCGFGAIDNDGGAILCGVCRDAIVLFALEV